MRLFSKLLMTLIILSFINTAHAAAIINCDPGDRPVKLIKVLEKNDTLTFIFQTNKSVGTEQISQISIFSDNNKKFPNGVKYDLHKKLFSWDFKFDLTKDDVDAITISISYRTASKKSELSFSCSSSYRINLSKFYAHYKKNN